MIELNLQGGSVRSVGWVDVRETGAVPSNVEGGRGRSWRVKSDDDAQWSPHNVKNPRV